MKLVKSWEEKERLLLDKYHHKIFTKFAYFPTRLTDGSYIWLVPYTKHTYIVHSEVFSNKYIK